MKTISNKRRFTRTAMAAVCICCICAVALGGCATPAADSSRADETDGDVPLSESDDIVSTALVVYNADGSVLFVDQDTETPYFPTLPDGSVLDTEGDAIGVEELAVGDLVEVHGNGIMLESYPGQYPGIYEVQVIGHAGDAEVARYDSLIAEVFPELGPEDLLNGYVSYRTDMADTTVLLSPLKYAYEDADGMLQTGTEEQWFASDGNEAEEAAAGTLYVPTANVNNATGAIVGFDQAIESIRIQTATLDPAVIGDGVDVKDPSLSWSDVAFSSENSKEESFTIEPGHLYHIEVQFENGSATYAFYVPNVIVEN